MVKRVEPEKPKVPSPPPIDDESSSSSDEWAEVPVEPFMCEMCELVELADDHTDDAIHHIPWENYCFECERYMCDECMGEEPFHVDNPLATKDHDAFMELTFCMECVGRIVRKRISTGKTSGKYKRRKMIDA